MTKTETYGKLEPDTLVRIKGQRGNYRFKYAMTFEADRPDEIRVVGGPSGHTAWRTFTADRVRLAPKRRRQTIDQTN